MRSKARNRVRKFRYSDSAAGTGSDSPSRSMRDVS